MANFSRANPKTGAMLLIGVPMAVSAGIYFAMKFMQKKKDHEHMSRVALHGGQLALQRLIDYHGERAKLDRAEAHIERSLNDKSQLPDLKKLQRAVAKLEMTSRQDKAKDKLKLAFVNAEREGKTHEAYEFQMLYTEMLIYKGEWKEALESKCLRDQMISDARRPLFMAMICIMSNKFKDGKKYWDEFSEIRENLHVPHILGEDGPCNLANNFDEFKTIVKLLQQDTMNVKAVYKS